MESKSVNKPKSNAARSITARDSASCNGSRSACNISNKRMPTSKRGLARHTSCTASQRSRLASVNCCMKGLESEGIDIRASRQEG